MATYDPPYKPSRAALRERYGTRSIGYAGQSSRDMTPSGRIKYKTEQNQYNIDPAYKEEIAKFEVAQDFQNNFQPRPAGFERPQDRMNSPWAGVTPLNYTAAPVMPLTPPAIAADPTGSAGLPTSPLAFNLSEPSSLPASVLSPYAPTTSSTAAYTPPWRKKPNQGYMGSILAPANKWLA